MNSKIVFVVGAGALVYFFLQNQNSLPADAVAVSSAALGAGTYTVGSQTLSGPGYVYYSPSTKLFYINTTAPTAAQLTAGAALFSTSAGSATAPAATATAPTTATTTAPPASTTAPVSSALAAIWAKVESAASQDASYQANGGDLTAYQWNTYISIAQAAAPTGYTGPAWPPDPQVVFPGIDLSQPMSGATYWSAMQHYLNGLGLSGVGGMGRLTAFNYRGPGGWAA